jgi:hypothetical protein
LAVKSAVSSSGVSTSSPTEEAMRTFSSTLKEDLRSVLSSIETAEVATGAVAAATVWAAGWVAVCVRGGEGSENRWNYVNKTTE